MPDADDVLIMTPFPAAFIGGITACIPRKVPVTLTSISLRKSFGLISSISPKDRMPALFTRMSIPPCSDRAFSIRTCQAFSSQTLSSTVERPGPEILASSSLRISAQITCFAPALIKSLAMARPIPLAAPVTIAILPSREWGWFMMSSFQSRLRGVVCCKIAKGHSRAQGGTCAWIAASHN